MYEEFTIMTKESEGECPIALWGKYAAWRIDK